MTIKIILASLVLLTLTGCASTGSKLPPLPGDLSLPCEVPDLRKDEALVSEVGNQRTALKKCANKVDRFQKFYKAL